MATTLLEQLKASADASNGNLQISVDDLQTLFASANAKSGDVKKTRRTRRAKDPSAPKRALSAYMLYLRDQRDSIIGTLVSEGVDLQGRNKVTQVAKRAGKLWGDLPDDEKAPYEAEAETLKSQYKEAMATYQPKDVVPEEDELPAAPDGFEGPFVNHYLWKNADRHAFFTLAEASARALELGSEECGGVTRQPSKDGTSRYFCRKPGPPIPCASDKGMVSWTMGYTAPTASDPVLTPRVQDEAETVETTPVPKKVKKAKGAAKKKEQPKVETKAPAKASTPVKKAAPKKKLQVDSAPEPDVKENSPEPEIEQKTPSPEEKATSPVEEIEVEYDENTDVDDDDDDDDGVAVEEVEHDGTTYLAAPTGEVYDYEAWTEREEMVVVGTYDASTGAVSLN